MCDLKRGTEGHEMNTSLLAVFGIPGGMEWIIILVIGLLLFGRRLPDVARSVGKSIVEFKKGMKDVKDDIDRAGDDDDEQPRRLEKKSSQSVGSPSREPQRTEARPD